MPRSREPEAAASRSSLFLTIVTSKRAARSSTVTRAMDRAKLTMVFCLSLRSTIRHLPLQNSRALEVALAHNAQAGVGPPGRQQVKFFFSFRFDHLRYWVRMQTSSPMSERYKGERGVCRRLPNLPLRAAVLRRAPSGGRNRM
jgi:hypothetical protein